jgi:D-lyxose ketol-isomerase
MAITRREYELAIERVLEYFRRVCITIRGEEERQRIEVTDFGLGRLYEIGLQLIVYVNIDRYCAKEPCTLPLADMP